MADPKVVCITNLDSELRQVVAGQALPGMNVISESLSADEGELMELVSDADFLIIWPAHISDDILRAAKRCKLVQCLSAGYDRFNLELSAVLGIHVANNGGANSVAVGETPITLSPAAHR
ncbi:MAG: hypothetical protein H8E48_11795, partial [Chloroflexi bacterium]|nr:hypothetical protein [Chloroflexota bacterium]